ncbi:DNA polymerase III, subunit gamma and tau [Ruminococcaceae bacterium YRB3002]|nr:DNA polymerase III, subunit gamma and tau [Ruminococcaceae bacterium YRB3002]
MDQEHIALYRRFRPQTFDEITYQDAPVAALKQAVKSGKIGHAYLFAGQRGTGKTTIAKVFSRAINCTNPKDGNPCNECEVCKGILNGSLLDVIEIDAASNNGVENVRRICEEAVFAPTKARYKVYIIDEVHMLSAGAYNALLKTLEEPPKHVVFLFATTEPHKILPTILSRCQRYSFKRIPDELIVKRLRYICDTEKIKAEDDALKQIATLSDGALRDAISLLDQTAGMADGKEITAKHVRDVAGTVDTAFIIEMGNVLIDGDYENLLRLCARISESGRDYVRFTLDMAQYFRDLLVIRVMADPTSLLSYSAPDMKQLYITAQKANPDTLIGFISYMSRMASDLKVSPSVAASFETGMIRICGRKTSLPIPPLVIPDFAAKQAEAAARISSGGSASVASAAAAVPAPAPAPAIAEPKKEEKSQEEKTSEIKLSLPVSEEKAEEKKQASGSLFGSAFVIAEPKKEPEKKEEKPKTESSEMSVTERLAKLRQSLSTGTSEESKAQEPKKEEPKQEAPKAPETPVVQPMGQTIITAPEERDENAPMENQIDLFSALAGESEPAKTQEPEKKQEEPKAPEPKAQEPKQEEPKPVRKNKIPVNESFVDDIEVEPKAAEKVPEKAPEKAPEKKGKTSLSAVYDSSGLIVSNAHAKDVRRPEFGDRLPGNPGLWMDVLAELQAGKPNLFKVLKNASFEQIEDCGYIVFDDKDRNVVENLKGMNEFRKLAQEIKARFDNVKRLFVCTKTQYGNAVAQNEKAKKQQEAEDLRAKAEQLGIITNLHFGDD